ncbi:MAG: hypothetical protein K8T25_21955, partial [Planctomycetia bacterium]|nr:hypothetical protein [Planctomycetia bacterium]
GQDFFCGLTFPVGKESCSLIVGGWGGQVVGLSNVDGAAADENQTTVHKVFEENRWYRIRLKVSPAAIVVSIDGEELINLPRGEHQFSIWPQQEPMRQLGIATWYTGAALKDIELRSASN